MKRVAGTTALALAVVLAQSALAPRRARATDILSEAGDDERPDHYQSPQAFAFELKFGPYRPDVDSEFNGKRTPYKDYFGNGRHLMSQVELDWQILRRFGSIAIGVGIGYFDVTGTAPLGNGSGVPSGDQSTLKVIPFSLSGVYRFDYFLQTRGFPVVPFGKLGLDYAYWSVADGNGEIATDGMGGTGRGGTRGWHAAAGAALVLDIFDPEAARDFDADLGVNHTALTFEFSHADLSGLGRAGQLHVGDTSWSLGVLMEF
ncbi:MAG TPA: MXAN_2562 family outer membrane beta-barrel protein [Polyangia bacterium]|nr:MXAN_2562 family outer membrane beta-barrel protein [Polyangia bacterium]